MEGSGEKGGDSKNTKVKDSKNYKGGTKKNIAKSIYWFFMRSLPIVIAIFLVVVVLASLVAMALSLIIFSSNQQTMTEIITETANAIADFSYENTAQVRVMIDHLERLQLMQRNAASHDVMAFLLSALSAILVAVCAGLAAKSRKSAKRAKDALTGAKEAIKRVKKEYNEVKTAQIDVNEKYENAKDGYSNAEKEYTQAKTVLLEIQEAHKGAEEEYENAKSEYEKAENAMFALNVHIEIVHARSALAIYDYTSANARLCNLPGLVKLLARNIYPAAIESLREEIRGIKTSVEHFSDHVENLPEGREKKTKLRAIELYNKWIDDAERNCDEILREIS